VHDNAQPKLYTARPAPFSLKQKVEQELQELQDKGINLPCTVFFLGCQSGSCIDKE